MGARHAAITSLIVLVIASACQSGAQKTEPTKIAEPPSSSAANSDPQLSSVIPLTESEERSIRDQVEANWNLGGLAGSPEVAGMIVELRLELLADGTVSKVEVMNDQPDNPVFHQLADSATRAVKLSSPLKLPPVRSFKAIRLKFHPDEAFE